MNIRAYTVDGKARVLIKCSDFSTYMWYAYDVSVVRTMQEDCTFIGLDLPKNWLYV